MRPQRTHLDVLRAELTLAGSRIVDVGCGAGELSRRLAEEGAQVIGVDPSRPAIARAAARAGRRERYLVGTAESLPVPDRHADVVTFLNSLHHVAVEALAEALGEARRVLRSDGLVYVQEPLAQGAYYEMVGLVDDERGVRAAAQRALRDAERAGLRPLAELEYDARVRHRDFVSFREHVLLVDERRTAAFAARAEELERRFYATAQREPDGWCFLQPTRVSVFRRVEAPP